MAFCPGPIDVFFRVRALGTDCERDRAGRDILYNAACTHVANRVVLTSLKLNPPTASISFTGYEPAIFWPFRR